MYARGRAHLNREAQIEEVLRQQPQCKFSPEKSELDFALQLKRGGRTDVIVVRIKLPADFPIEAPHAFVLADHVRHPWVDANGTIVGCSSLYTWNAHSKLANVVADIINQFVSQPPSISAAGGAGQGSSQQTYPHLPPRRQSSPAPHGALGGAATHGHGRASMPSPASSLSGAGKNRARSDSDGVFIPQVPDKISELDEKTPAELELLLNDDEECEKFFTALPIPTMTNDTKIQIMKSNIEQAETNLSFKERLEQLQAEVLRLQEQAVPKWNAYKELEARQSEAMRQYDPLRLLTQLESSCTKLDDESELLASEFLMEEISLTDFIKRQMELRKLYHLRKAKAERFRIELKRSSGAS